jgi:exonuclease SbcD
MRLLHVSDWHLGAALGRLSRDADHDEVITEMCAIAEDCKPHLILHTGDLFDHGRPSAVEMRRALDALARLALLAPVVVLAGNHDSPALFEVFNRLIALGSSLASRQNVTFVPRARPPDAGGILTFPGDPEHPGEEVRLAPVPFIQQNSVLELFGVPPGRWTAEYRDQVQKVEAALAAGLQTGYDPAKHVLLFAAHLHVDGAIFSTSERRVHVSDTYATETEHLPPVSYAAFGHIHRPQQLPGVTTGRYAGSPIPIDFGELGEQKSVVFVEATPGTTARIETIPVSGGRPLRREEGKLEHLLASDPGRCIAYAVVDVDDRVPDLADQLARSWPDADFFDIVERVAGAQVEAVAATDGDAEPPLADLFREYLAATGTSASIVDSAMNLFDRLHQTVQDDPTLTDDPAAVAARLPELASFELPDGFDDALTDAVDNTRHNTEPRGEVSA